MGDEGVAMPPEAATEYRHLRSLRARLVNMIRLRGGQLPQEPPPQPSLDELQKEVQQLLLRVKSRASPAAGTSTAAAQRQLQTALGQNARLRRLALKVHGLAPNAPDLDTEVRLLREGSATDAASRQHALERAAARVGAQNLLLLKGYTDLGLNPLTSRWTTTHTFGAPRGTGSASRRRCTSRCTRSCASTRRASSSADWPPTT